MPNDEFAIFKPLIKYQLTVMMSFNLNHLPVNH